MLAIAAIVGTPYRNRRSVPVSMITTMAISRVLKNAMLSV
jgi:hypothetical protein